MTEVKPEFELVTYIVASFVERDFSTVFQVKIVVGLNAFASTVGKVGRQEGKTKNDTYGND